MAGAETSGTAVATEGQVVAQGDRLRAAAATAAALARRYFLYQPVRQVLLLVQCAGWMQPISRALGFAGVDEGSGYREDSGTRQGEVPRGQAADHFRQWTAVHRPRLQGVHSY